VALPFKHSPATHHHQTSSSHHIRKTDHHHQQRNNQQQQASRSDASFHIPTQKQRREKERPQVHGLVQWKQFERRHDWLLRGQQVRNNLLRKVLGYYKNLDVNRDTSQVVYAVVHPKTSKIYIGSTKYNCNRRFKEHLYQRYATKGSQLSKHMATRDAATLNNIAQQYFVFPLEVFADDFPTSRYEERELDWMRKFRKRNLLNSRVLRVNTRKRHVPPPTGPPSNGPPPAERKYATNTVVHLLQLSAIHRCKQMQKMSIIKLRSVKHAAPHGSFLRAKCDEYINKKEKETATDKPKPRYLVLPFQSTAQEKISIKKILEKHRKLLHEDVDYRVSYKLGPTVGQTLFNFTEFALQPKSEQPCMCAKLGLPDSQLCKGHLLTTDPKQLYTSFNRDEIDLLVDTLAQGMKHRISKKKSTVMQLFTDAIRAEAGSQNEKWGEAMIGDFQSELFGRDLQASIPQVNLKNIASKIHEHYMVTPCDKNAQKAVFWCKKLYQEEIENHLKEVYRLQERSPVQVMDALEHINRRHGFAMSPTFPYLYLLPKLHRLETHRAPIRPISGKSEKNRPANEPKDRFFKSEKGKSAMSHISSVISSVGNLAFDTIILDEINNDIRYCWVVRDPQESIDMMSGMPSETRKKGLRTDDFTACFTAAQQDDICESLTKFFDLEKHVATSFDMPTFKHLAKSTDKFKVSSWATRPQLSSATPICI